MQHCPARAAQRLAAAVLALVLLLCAFLPHAHAAELKEKNGIRLLSFDTSHILSIGNQTSGKCSLYALRYARTILDGKVQSDLVQDPATRERNREALFASLEGNMRIGGDSASGEVHQKTAAELASYAAPAAAVQQPEQPKP
mgnify:CR=1 FL=1